MTTTNQFRVGDVVAVAACRRLPAFTFTLTHVGRRYSRGVTADGTPIAETGNGLLTAQEAS